MSSTLKPGIMAFKAGGAIPKGSVVKPGADEEHVVKSSAATDKHIGIAQNAAAAAGDMVEVAIVLGAKGLAGGTFSFGDLLTSDSNGALVATTTANDKIIAQAMGDAVANDIAPTQIVKGNY